MSCTRIGGFQKYRFNSRRNSIVNGGTIQRSSSILKGLKIGKRSLVVDGGVWWDRLAGPWIFGLRGDTESIAELIC